ncbi:unnamed protein product, partial [Eretmochelys imbricata]
SGRAPQYILQRGIKTHNAYSDTADFAKERFSSQADKSSTELKVTALEVADKACICGAALGNSVQSNEPEVSGSAGGSVTLSCSYTTSDSYAYLYWYRQYPNQTPQYILWRGAKSISGQSNTANFAQKRFSSQADDSSTVLNITALELADSAVYLCALRLAQ